LDLSKKIVLPGEEIDINGFKQGNGLYFEDGKYYSYQLGLIQVYNNFVNVIPLSGKYFPSKNDKVIAKVIEIAPSFWVLDINSPYPAFLHVNDTPWKPASGELAKILNVGDTVYAKINEITESRQIWLSIKEPGLRKIEGGHIITVQPSKVSRIIGKGGSMVNMIKESTGVKIQLGQNGVVWLDGEPEKVLEVIKILKFIEEESTASGLTDAVRSRLEKSR